MGEPTTVWLCNEHGRSWPLDVPDDSSEAPLPLELSARVRAWTRRFEAHHDPERGWPTHAHRAASFVEGLQLEKALQAAVDPGVEIRFAHWESIVDGQDPALFDIAADRLDELSPTDCLIQVNGRQIIRGSEVRMFDEYSVSWPFWARDGLLDPEDFPLPDQLTRQILAWTRDFDLNYDHERGWPTAEHREASHQEGLRLADEVQSVVGPDVIIDFQYWETGVDDR